jgi:hypothetical protein
MISYLKIIFMCIICSVIVFIQYIFVFNILFNISIFLAHYVGEPHHPNELFRRLSPYNFLFLIYYAISLLSCWCGYILGWKQYKKSNYVKNINININIFQAKSILIVSIILYDINAIPTILLYGFIFSDYFLLFPFLFLISYIITSIFTFYIGVFVAHICLSNKLEKA